MINWINEISSAWADYVLLMTVQNVLFLSGIMALLYILRNHDARLLRCIALVGLVKLFIPPFFTFSTSTIRYYTVSELTNTSTSSTLSSSGTLYSAAPEGFTLSMQTMLMTGWLFLASLLAVYIFVQLVRLCIIVKKASPVNVSSLLPQRTPRNVYFLKSKNVHSPLVFGLIKHRILLPATWDSLPADCKKTVLAHEIAHIKHFDHWINLFQIMAQMIHFFNPLAWLHCKKLCYLNEIVCDDSAARSIKFSPINYSKNLVRIVENIVHPLKMYSPALSLFNSNSNLTRRVIYQLSKKRGNQMKKMSMKDNAILVVVALAVMPFSWYNTENVIINLKNTPTEQSSEFSAVSYSPADTIFIDIIKGNDLTGKGTRIQPYKTLDKALAVIRALESGGTIQVLQSTYEVLPPTAQQEEIPVFLPMENQPSIIGGKEKLMEFIEYPPLAKQANIQGTLVLQVLINEKGEPIDFRVTNDLKGGFFEAAVKAIKLVRFKPAVQRNRPVKFWYTIPIKFTIKSGEIQQEPFDENEPQESSNLSGIETEILNRPVQKIIGQKEDVQQEEIPEFLPPENQPVIIGGRAALRQHLVYPDEARINHIQGQVILRVLVNEQGEPVDFEFIKSLDKGSIDEAAVEAVKKVRFIPATQRGEIVKFWYTIPIKFELDSGDKENPNQNDLKRKTISKNYRNIQQLLVGERETQLNEMTTEKEPIPQFLPVQDQPAVIGGIGELMKNIAYPRIARLADIQGKVVIQVLVNEQGKPSDFKVLQTQGYDGFANAAITGIKKVRFIPAKQRGKPVKFWYTIPIKFQFRGNEQKD